jgi:hypothetical protein
MMAASPITTSPPTTTYRPVQALVRWTSFADVPAADPPELLANASPRNQRFVVMLQRSPDFLLLGWLARAQSFAPAALVLLSVKTTQVSLNGILNGMHHQIAT